MPCARAPKSSHPSPHFTHCVPECRAKTFVTRQSLKGAEDRFENSTRDDRGCFDDEFRAQLRQIVQAAFVRRQTVGRDPL